MKSSALNYLNKMSMKGEQVSIPDLAASFQKAVVDVLVEKTLTAASRFKVRNILLAGGVAANSRLRQDLIYRAGDQGINIIYPPPVLCTDNAGMVACAGYYKYLRGDTAPLTLNAVPGLKLGADKY